ncbi:unnamed protein product [Adineta steineri]|uniref:Uncharacterized protein n=1 Tax=Adineta steineri TaxID=433720 RepID=A0A819LAB0_9BILA|nr:unnamed protein product [Adineta steineri]
MSNGSRTTTISSIAPLTTNDYGDEINSLHKNSTDHIVTLTRNSSHGKSNSICSRLAKVVQKYNFVNVEERGIERVLPQHRTDSKIINTGMIWVGANIIIPCFAMGTLGSAVFKLDLYESFVTIILFNIIGIIPIAAVACFGPASGLRTMTFSRYSWGYYGASIMAFLNVLNALGWAAVNSITGAQALRVVTDDKLPMATAIIIICILSMCISFVGYKWIHTYERYSWIPVFIGFCIVAVISTKYMTHSSMTPVNAITADNINHWNIFGIISFGTLCLGSTISWCSFSADYNTYFPEDTNQFKIFFFTYMGNFLSVIPLELLGAAVYTGTYTNKNWSEAYEKNNVGGLLGASLLSLGIFGKFILILFALSTVACNIPNIYSLSLSSQVIASIFERIPRILYIIIGSIISAILGIAGANNFNSALTSFTDVISYWFSIFIVILFEEHFIFRRCSYRNYDFNIWNNRKVLPISIAAILSGLIGIIGIILGMSQTWYQGLIPKAIAVNHNGHSPDLGFVCGFLFTAITFPIFRFLELHFIKR